MAFSERCKKEILAAFLNSEHLVLEFFLCGLSCPGVFHIHCSSSFLNKVTWTRTDEVSSHQEASDENWSGKCTSELNKLLR